MRTTVDLDDALLARAKRLALGERTSLSRIVGDALAAYLGIRQKVESDPPFELIVRGKAKGRFPTPTEMIAVEEDEDRSALAIPRTRTRAAP